MIQPSISLYTLSILYTLHTIVPIWLYMLLVYTQQVRRKTMQYEELILRPDHILKPLYWAQGFSLLLYQGNIIFSTKHCVLSITILAVYTVERVFCTHSTPRASFLFIYHLSPTHVVFSMERNTCIYIVTRLVHSRKYLRIGRKCKSFPQRNNECLSSCIKLRHIH